MPANNSLLQQWVTCWGIIASSRVGSVSRASALVAPRPRSAFIAMFEKSAAPQLPLPRLWKPSQDLITSQLFIIFSTML